ncbi:hypothetical protein LSCM4_02842 [Leishmania orientalis]|uniref:Uncharacterized protein n=1 Tax=Leishmania orientalis TaxID=2249476 RepID=A0A836GUK5_9TRYP|nr:hypothetical protein LSCM4_02842 [Leishmania orientalis]
MQLATKRTDTNVAGGEVAPAVATFSSPHRSSSSSAPATPSASPAPQRAGESSLMNATTETVAVTLLTPSQEAGARCHHSRASSSAESRDSVDELASSAFLDCRSAAPLLTTYSQQQQEQPSSSVDYISFTARGASTESPNAFRIRTFHHDVGGGSEESDEERVGGGHTGRNTEETNEPDNAASEAAAVHDAIIEVAVAVNDDLAPTPRETREGGQQMASAVDEMAEVNEDTSSDALLCASNTLREKDRWPERQLSILRGGLSTEDVDTALTPAAASCLAAPRRTDSKEWTATRKTALEQLRAKLHHAATAANTAFQCPWPSRSSESEPGRAHVLHCSSEALITPGHPLQPSPSFEDLSQANAAGETARSSETCDRPQSETNTAADILAKLLGESYIKNSADSDQSSRSRKGAETDGGVDDGESLSLLISTTHTPATAAAGLAGTSVSNIDASGGRFVVRPALSADVSGISPIKNEAPSILAELYSTPDSRPPAAAILRPSSRSLTVATPSSLAYGRRTLQDALEAMQEPSADVATGDFCTVQTAPSTASASVEATSVSDRELRNASMMTAAATSDAEDPLQSRHSSRRHHASLLDRRQVLSGAVPDPNGDDGAGSGTQSHAEASLLAQTASCRGETTQLNRGRSRGRQAQPCTEHSAAKASTVLPAHESTELTRPSEWRQHRIEQEMRAKEMAECTFHPLLSPGTRAIVRLAQERELERTLHEEEREGALAAGTRSKSAQTRSSETFLDPSTLRATLQTVYERLYPAELSAAASCRQILDQEMEYRRLAREELILLRRRCGVAQRAPRSARGGGVTRTRDQFNSFMSTILQTDWKEAPKGTGAPLPAANFSSLAPPQAARGAAPTVAILQTSYRSPMAVALREEQSAKRKYNSRREAEMHGQHVDAGEAEVAGPSSRCGAANSMAGSAEATRGEESFRVALFDEFLLRQNAYYCNRARTVRALEKMLTPDFIPSTTDASTRLVRKMVSRSLLNESMGPETSSIVAQRQRQRIPFTSLLVKQHTSPYVDPCTFQPNISPAARAAKEEDRRRQRANKQSPAAQQKSFFERLYADQERRARRREDAKKRVEAEEVEGLTFQPALNVKCNARVHSLLNPRNYQPYQAYLHEKRRWLDAKRRELEEEAKQAEEDVCTFRPQTTKKPAYIEKMVKSFGVLRKQDTEF